MASRLTAAERKARLTERKTELRKKLKAAQQAQRTLQKLLHNASHAYRDALKWYDRQAVRLGRQQVKLKAKLDALVDQSTRVEQ